MSVVGSDIEAAALAILKAVVFTGVDASNIIARALPKVDDDPLDRLPMIVLAAADEDEGHERIATEGIFEIVYKFQLSRIDAGNRNYLVKPLAREFKQLVRVAFAGPTFTGMPTVWKPEFRLGRVFDRATLSQQYTYSDCVLSFFSVESGG